MRRIHTTLELALLRAPGARRIETRVNAWVILQLIDRPDSADNQAVSVLRIGIHVAEDDEPLVIIEPTRNPCIIPEIARVVDVIRPQPDLIEVPVPVSILCAIERRRRRMTREQMEDVPRLQFNRQIHVILRR